MPYKARKEETGLRLHQRLSGRNTVIREIMNMHKLTLYVLALCSLLLYGCGENQPPTTPESEASGSASTPWLQEPQETVLLNESVKVSPGTYRSWELSLSAGAQLHGKISSEPDINVWLLSPREYEAFKNGETFYYHSAASRKQSLGFTFTYTIPKTEKYYFVLDNKSSWFTSKSVSVYLKVIQ